MYHSVQVTTKKLVSAYNETIRHHRIEHTDAMVEEDLVEIRKNLSFQMVGDVEMLSLIWIRNEVVRLRKAGKLDTQDKLLTQST